MATMKEAIGILLAASLLSVFVLTIWWVAWGIFREMFK
jgi:hypothetical protein